MARRSWVKNPKILILWLVISLGAIGYAAYTKEWLALVLLCLILPFDVWDLFKAVKR